MIDHPNEYVATAAVQILRLHPVTATEVLTADWIVLSLIDPSPRRRRLAALAIISVRGGAHRGWLHALLRDTNPSVAGTACHAAASLGQNSYLPVIIGLLGNPRERRDVIESLTTYGAGAIAALAASLTDAETPLAVRRHTARPGPHPEPEIRRSVARLPRPPGPDPPRSRRRVARKAPAEGPDLDYGPERIAEHVLAEARHYCELHAILAPIGRNGMGGKATSLLARTLENRSDQAIHRLFHLLGLRYPPNEMQAAYRSLRGTKREETIAALELLENVLEHSLRRVIVPLLDAPGSVVEKGRTLFNIEVGTLEAALSELIETGDPWLSACAAASASEQGIQVTTTVS